MALLAHLCRSNVPPQSSKVYLLPFADDADMLSRCAMILKIAEICDRSRDDAVKSAEVSNQGDRVHITLIADRDISMVLWKMETVPEEFQKIFGLDLRIDHRTIPRHPRTGRTVCRMAREHIRYRGRRAQVGTASSGRG